MSKKATIQIIKNIIFCFNKLCMNCLHPSCHLLSPSKWWPCLVWCLHWPHQVMVHDGQHLQHFQETQEGTFYFVNICSAPPEGWVVSLSTIMLVSELRPHQSAGAAGHPGGQWGRLRGGDRQEVPLAGEFPAVPGTEGQGPEGDVLLQSPHFATGEHEPLAPTGGHQDYLAGDGKTILPW